MGVVEFPDWRFVASDVPAPDSAAVPTTRQPSLADRIRGIWPVFVVGFGLVASVVWMGLLVWLFYRAVLMLSRNG